MGDRRARRDVGLILLSTVWGFGLWLAAYWFAGVRAGPDGDTSFFWLPIVVVQFFFGAGLVALVFAVLGWLDRTPDGVSRNFRLLSMGWIVLWATLIDAFTLSTVQTGDGWPAEWSSIVALVVSWVITIGTLPLCWKSTLRQRFPHSSNVGEPGQGATSKLHG